MQINNINFLFWDKTFWDSKLFPFARINFGKECSDKKFGKIIVYVYRKNPAF